MLRAEDGAQGDAVGGDQPIDDVLQAAVHRRVIADDADAEARKAARGKQQI